MRNLIVVVALLAGCNEQLTVHDPPLVIGVLAPKTGALAPTGAMMEQIATLAQDRIDAEGGIDGQRLEIVVEDVGDAPDASAAFQRLVDRGAVAVVGPATQEQVVSVVPTAVADHVVFASPISTTPWRVDGRPADDGYMFRVVASDELQTLALAYYLRALDPEKPHRISVLTESTCACGTSACNLAEGDVATEQALGVFDYFKCFFEKPAADGAPRTIINTLLYRRDSTTADVNDTVNQINSLDPIPDVVVLAGFEADAIAIMRAWIATHPNASTDQPLRWVTTATTKTPGFTADMPADVYQTLPSGDVPVSGSAPTPPIVGHAYAALQRAYHDATGADVADLAFAPNVWDAVYLLSTALAAQSIDGGDLRDAVRSVSSGGPTLHAGQWIDLTAILQNGGDVDYDGASGPVDLDDQGEVTGPYEIWQVQPRDAGFAFERAFYIDARNVPQALTTFGVAGGGTIDDLIATCAIPPPDACP